MSQTNAHLHALLENVRPLRQRLLAHPLYSRLHSLQDLQRFQESHVFAVWDFMSLLKALQRELTCVELPWLPRGRRQLRRLVNSIVLEEESDSDGLGGYTSHFELYTSSMVQLGSDTTAIEGFVKRLQQGETVSSALQHTPCPPAARSFVQNTWSVVRSGSPHILAAAFTLGREDVIPEMFQQMVRELARQQPSRVERFEFYLNRHIALDQTEHAPMARELLCELCADDPEKWAAAEATTRACLWARLSLWDGVLSRLEPLGAPLALVSAE